MADWVIRLIEQSGYLGVGFLMFLETLFPPIPSEIIMPVAGVAAGQGKLNLAGAIAAGGTAEASDLTGTELEICAALGPELKRRGLLFVGIDVIGGRWLTEINVTSPTGIVAIDKFNGSDTPGLIWQAIERKLAERGTSPGG